MKKRKNNLKNWSRIYLLPILLLFVWLFLTLFYIFNNNFSLSVISYSHNKNNFLNYNKNKITAGETIVGHFLARENNLGIVSVSFTTFNQVPYSEEDVLLFSIKEKGAKEWYYQNTYRSGLINDSPLFPFGFSKLPNSKNKNYVFEIQSLKGNSENAVALNNWEPVLVSRYQLSKSEIMDNPLGPLPFFAKRTIIAFGSQDVQFFSFIYFLPLFFYLLLFFPSFAVIFRPLARKTRFRVSAFMLRYSFLRPFYYLLQGVTIPFLKYFDVIIFLLILFNIFCIPILNDFALVVIAILWVHLANYYKDSSRKSFAAGLFLIILCPIILALGYDNIAEKSAAWAYTFFTAGAVQIFLNERRKKSLRAVSGAFEDRFYLPFLRERVKKLDVEGKNFAKFLHYYVLSYVFIKNRKKVFNFLIIILILLNLFLIERVVVNKFFGDPCVKPDISLKTEEREGPLIRSIEPTYVHYGDKVVIKGDNFDWSLNRPLKIFTNYGEIKADYWDSTTIIFSVPLDFKEKKEITFWLSTPSGTIGDSPISNTAKVTLLNRLGEFSEDDIRYLRQNRCLSPKAKEINNFTNFKLGKYRYLVEFFLKFL